MSFPFFFGVSRPFGRTIVGAVVLLLLVSAAEICSATEVTFGGNCSFELPPGWTQKSREDKSSFLAEGPGGVRLLVKSGESTYSLEEMLAQNLSVFEKKPGFKVLDKGSLTTKAGLKAQLLRYQTDRNNVPETTANYYLQLADKHIAIFVFMLPPGSGPSKSYRSDIEAIVNSVKSASAASDDDSWLTKPAEKSKGDSKAPSSDDSKIAGKYVLAGGGGDYMELKADGTFSFQMRGESGTGTYVRNGATITLKFTDTDTDDAKLDKDVLIGKDGSRWVKKP
ncbi:MAG: hypothetical protein QOH88_452 [Verrucomicrobiota bacterium]|jgi:hypothetical protein